MPANSGMRNCIVKQKGSKGAQNSSIPSRGRGGVTLPTSKKTGTSKVTNATHKRK